MSAALADLPRFADSPQSADAGFRAAMLQRDREQLERTNRLLRECLAELLPLASRRAHAGRRPGDRARDARA